MVKLPTLLEMLKAGAHFGHQKSRWHPKMAPYLFGVRNGVHVIDLEKTLEQLEKTLTYVQNQAAEGKVILFVGTKRQARAAVEAAAKECGMPFLTERWIGGLLTNFDEFQVRLKKFNKLAEEIANGEIERYTKKEQVNYKKMYEKMSKYLIGLKSLNRLPDALYLADMRVEKTALAEAERMHVPVVAVCDSNVNPNKANHVIPANDDAVNSIKMMAGLIAAAVKEGQVEWEKKKLKMEKERLEKAPIIVQSRTVAPKTEPVKKAAPVVRKERRAVKKEESV